MAAPLASKAGSAGTTSKPPFPELDFRSGARVEELNKLIQEFTKHDQREYDDQRALEIHTAKDFIFSMLGRAGTGGGGGAARGPRGPQGPRGRAPGRAAPAEPSPAAGSPAAGPLSPPANCFFLALPPPLRRCCVCTSREGKQGGRAGRCWRSTPKPAGLQARRARACIVFPPSYPSCRKHRFFFSFYLLFFFFFHAFWLLDRLMLEQEHPLSCGSCLGCKTCCEWSKSDCGGGVLLCAKL